jgi:predicted enzyme related to lactoylglutathione lyase
MSVVFVPRAEVDRHAANWSQVLGVPADTRMPVDEFGLTVMTVGHIAIVGATEAARAAVGAVRSVIVVADLDHALGELERIGATIIDGPMTIPPGRSVYVTMPDGTVAEWVEHRPRPGERPSGPDPNPPGPPQPQTADRR